MTTKRALLLATLLTVVAVALAIRFYAHGQPPAPIPVVIAEVQAPVSGLLDIALAKGYFAAEGLAVTTQKAATGNHAIQAILSGKADFGTSAPTPIAKALVAGKKLKVIASISSGEAPDIIARKDRGIAVPSDLSGKRIAVVPGTVSQYMLETFLAFHRIPLEAVVIVGMMPDQMVPALVAGEVDAATICNPQFSLANHQLGDKAQVFSFRETYAADAALAVRPDYLPRNRETVDRLLRALFKAESFVNAYPNESMNIVARATNTELRYIQEQWHPLSYKLTLSQSLLLSTEIQARWVIRRGFVPGGVMPDIISAFDIEPLRAINPARVSIVK